jgi:hypothetical protein
MVEEEAKQETSMKQLARVNWQAEELHAVFFLHDLFFDPEDGDDMFLPNVG